MTVPVCDSTKRIDENTRTQRAATPQHVLDTFSYCSVLFNFHLSNCFWKFCLLLLNSIELNPTEKEEEKEAEEDSNDALMEEKMSNGTGTFIIKFRFRAGRYRTIFCLP